MNFTQAISSGFNNYVNFTGRAARSEFWYWTLFAILASIAGELIDLALFSSSSTFTPVQTLAISLCSFRGSRSRSDACMILIERDGGFC